MSTVLMLIADGEDRDAIDRWLRAAGHEPIDPPGPEQPDLVIAALDQVHAQRELMERLRSRPAPPPVLVLGDAERLEAALPVLVDLIDDVIERPLRESLLGVRVESQLHARAVAAELDEARAREQSSRRARARFLVHVSHQLRGPLGVILGFSRLLETSDDASPETREFASLIQRAGETQLKLVEDLVDLAAAGAGELSLEMAPVSLAGLLGAVAAEVGDAASARDVELTVDDLGELAVMADAARLRLVLAGLLSRAVDASSAGGRVTVVATRDEDAVEIAVAGAAEDPELTGASELLGAMGGTITVDAAAGPRPIARVRLAPG